MKIKKVASVLIMMIAILLIAGIFSASYAATSMSLTISRFHASGFGYQAGNDGKFVWKIKNLSKSNSFEDTIYCLKGGKGFGSNMGTGSVTTVTYNKSFDMRESIPTTYSNVLPSGTTYNSLMWLLDNVYVPSSATASADRKKLLDDAYEYACDNVGNFDESDEFDFITDEDIDAVQQMAIWYFTNTDNDGYKVSQLQLYINAVANSSSSYNALADEKGNGSDNGEEREMETAALFDYLINTALSNSNYSYSEADNTQPYEIKKSVTENNGTVEIQGNNYIIGPFRISKLSESQGELNVSFYNGTRKITSPALQDENGKSIDVNNLEKYAGKDFYLVLPASTNLDTIKFSIDGSYYLKTTLTYWNVENQVSVNQPVVKIEKENEPYDDEVTITPEKKFDLALRKFITSINNVQPTTSRVPQISSSTLSNLKNGTIDTAEKTHTKDALTVKTGDKVIYTIRIYNEGEVDGYATEITDYLPDGLKLAENSTINNTYGWTNPSGDGKTIVTSYLSTSKLSAFTGTTLDYEDVKIECEVTATPGDNSITMKNIAEITVHKDSSGNTRVTDRDSTPKNLTSSQKQNYNPGTSTRGWGYEDDDDYENIIMLPNDKKFDLALRKFITSINNVKPTISREPQISSSTLNALKNGTITTAEKIHPKNALTVKTGDKVIYTIRVYNEGEIDGYATEIADYLPDGLKLAENSKINNTYGWTQSGTAKKIVTTKLSTKLLKAFDGTKLDYADVQVECKVTASITTGSKELKNIAEITKHKDIDGNTTVKDIDSVPDNVIIDHYGTTNQQDDDDFEDLILIAQKFDLALRKYITSINGIAPKTSREPVITTDTLKDLKDGKITTAVKTHPKNALLVQTGDKVIYTIRVYNEGEVDGYVKEITDYLPDGLKFLEDSTLNKNNGWSNPSGDGKTIVTSKQSGTLLKAFDGSNLQYTDVQIECEVIATVTDNDKTLKNIAEITAHSDKNGDTTIKDIDSDPNNVDRDKYGTTNQEDDDDFELLVLQGKYFDLALRKFITKVNDTELTSRIPTVDVTPLLEGKTTATYRHPKNPVSVDVGDIVTYTLRVYNEGEVDGYANEITDYLPQWLEFINDEENAKYGWKVSADGRKVTTTITSKDTEYSASRDVIYANRTSDSDKVLIKAFDKNTKTLDYIDVKIKCKVKDTGLATKITNIAEITKASNSEGVEVVDRDSVPDNITLPTDELLPNYKDDEIARGDEYIPGQEDDDDFEKVIIQKFDLSLRKFITAVNDKEITNRVPVFSIDSDGKYVYTHTKEPVEVANKDIVTYTLRVYNEGNVDGFADEVKDDVPQGLEFLPDNAINKEYRWKMYKEDGTETTNVSEAKTIRSDYLSKAQQDETKRDNLLKAFDKETMTQPDHRDIKIAFKVTEPNTSDRILINTAEISKDKDKDGKDVDDIDSTPDNDKDGEDDIDIEKVKVKYFDLALEKIVTEYSIKLDGKTTVTKTNHKFGVQPEPVVKVELVNSHAIKASVIKFKYQIKITNEGEIEGYADEVKDYIPEGLKFVAEDNPKWKASSDGKTVTTDQLKDTLLKPGDSAIVEITLQWINGQNNLGLKQNWAEISKDRNDSDSPDIDSTPDNNKKGEDDIDDASVILSVKTGKGEDFAIIAGGMLIILSTGIVLIKKFVI